MRKRIGQLAGEGEYSQGGYHPFVSEAPVQILVCTSEKVYRDRYSEPDKLGPNGEQIEWPIPYWYVDAGCSMMIILLAAVSEGLAAAFVGLFPDPRQANELLGIPPDFVPIGVIMIGHGAPDVPSPSLNRGRRPLETVLHRERW
jgi:nitroreductase